LDKSLSKLLSPGVGVYLVVMALFALISAFFSVYLAVAEGVVVLLLVLFYVRSGQQRKRDMARYIDTLANSVDAAARDSMINSPLPTVIFRPEREDIIWSNDRFLQITGSEDHLFDTKLSAVVPGFDTRWLMEGKPECPTEVAVGDHSFLVYGHLVRTGEKGTGFLAATYWVDITDFSSIRREYYATRPIAAILMLDNYEDLMKNLNENQRSALLSELDTLLDAWSAPANGLLRKLERDRYLFIFQEQHLSEFSSNKFDILDQVHQVVNPNGIAATLSIGIGKDADSFQELFQSANLSIDMALSRGGDQAVIRNGSNFEFYGGRSTESEKRTKVKSRVMANALSSIIMDSSQVFVMGHKLPDLDASGAAAGVCAIARKLGVRVHIIKELGSHPSKVMTDKLEQLPEYAGCFLAPQEALVEIDARSLLVVVDTNRPEQVQSQEVLDACQRVAVIDHHRRAATYIDGAALNYHEPYASSASELVSELLQYIVEPSDLLRTEAEALLAGIVLDTKNFTMRTGGRTFEAAAFLRRSGADTGEVKKLFQNNLDDTIAKYSIIQNAKLFRSGIAVAVVDHPVGRVTAAQAADDLLNIMGINASFVVFPDKEQIILSARSMGNVNVQVVLEQLGGGGNAAAAGCQVSGKTLEEVTRELAQAIDQYLEDG